MEIASVEPARTAALVLEIVDAPQIVALARDSNDVQILTVDTEAAAPAWFGQLPSSPESVVADVRAVRALLGDESGRAWLAAVRELSLALPAGEESALLQTATDLAALGLRAEHVEHDTTTVVVRLRPSGGDDETTPALTKQVVAAFARAAAEASSAAGDADRARRDEALALSRLRANIEHDAERASWEREQLRSSRWSRGVRQPVVTGRRVLRRVKRRLT